MKLRSDYKDAFVEKHGVKLGFMSGFVKVRRGRLISVCFYILFIVQLWPKMLYINFRQQLAHSRISQ